MKVTHIVSLSKAAKRRR